MSYEVYRVVSAGMPRDHHSIFVETSDDGSGYIFQVVGNIQNGMEYDDKPAERPDESATFQGKVYIGKVSVANYPRIKAICTAIPAPKKQFEGPHCLFPGEPLRRCQEWTKEAIDALLAAGVLEN
ncbi:hypothetical protein BJY01DRAFT_252506 [Aspergillus pseudoustus]|uniref:Uncharacterized protein n=1 Tax=Aspergillus pseudoustus TaxID=1810923 RepID=A0ABR4J6H3_9EURO